MDATGWSTHVASLAADSLLDHKLIRSEDFDSAVTVIADEVNTRLALGDYPPPQRQSEQKDA